MITLSEALDIKEIAPLGVIPTNILLDHYRYLWTEPSTKEQYHLSENILWSPSPQSRPEERPFKLPTDLSTSCVFQNTRACSSPVGQQLLTRSTCLTHITNNLLKNIDKGLLTGLVFLDLSKAFDTLDHYTMLDKLPSLIVHEPNLKRGPKMCFRSTPLNT